MLGLGRESWQSLKGKVRCMKTHSKILILYIVYNLREDNITPTAANRST